MRPNIQGGAFNKWQKHALDLAFKNTGVEAVRIDVTVDAATATVPIPAGLTPIGGGPEWPTFWWFDSITATQVVIGFQNPPPAGKGFRLLLGRL